MRSIFLRTSAQSISPHFFLLLFHSSGFPALPSQSGMLRGGAGPSSSPIADIRTQARPCLRFELLCMRRLHRDTDFVCPGKFERGKSTNQKPPVHNFFSAIFFYSPSLLDFYITSVSIFLFATHLVLRLFQNSQP